LRTAFAAEDTRPGPTERVVPGSTLVDLGGGMEIAESFALRIWARNLLNDSYLASQDVRTVAAPGRSVALTAVVRFSRR
jgi:outer membrane receptor protein involved in Fe transport